MDEITQNLERCKELFTDHPENYYYISNNYTWFIAWCANDGIARRIAQNAFYYNYNECRNATWEEIEKYLHLQDIREYWRG